MQNIYQWYLTPELRDKLYVNLFLHTCKLGDQDNGFNHLFVQHCHYTLAVGLDSTDTNDINFIFLIYILHMF